MTADSTIRAMGLRGDLEQLLEDVSAGRIDVAVALEQLASLPFRDLGFARVDTHRELRQGAPEAVLAEGKTVSEVEQIVRALL
jgi:NCAIR mutase (PurE)-related protein